MEFDLEVNLLKSFINFLDLELVFFNCFHFSLFWRKFALVIGKHTELFLSFTLDQMMMVCLYSLLRVGRGLDDLIPQVI